MACGLFAQLGSKKRCPLYRPPLSSYPPGTGTLRRPWSNMKSKYRRYKRNPSEPRNNPPLFTDLAEFVVPGFAGFAASRFVTRMAAVQVEKFKPSLGKHAGAVAAVGTFLAAWFLAHKVKFLAKHHTPLVVGSAIAALQSIIQLYIPQLGWMLADATPELVATAAVTQSPPLVAADAVARMGLQPTTEDPNEFTFNEQFDPGRMDHIQHAANVQASSKDHDHMMDDVIGSTANLGVFNN